MVIKALLDGSINGVGKFHRTSIFPCGIFQCGNGINLNDGDPNYDLFKLALKSTSKRLYPNYACISWSGNRGYDVEDPRTYFSTMGCRTASGVDINADPGQNPQMKDGRGNLSPVTIIMTSLVMECREKLAFELEKTSWQEVDWNDEVIQKKLVESFITLLDKKIHEAKDMLLERFDWQCSQPEKSAKFMYENGTILGYKPEEGIRSALKHGTLVIGQLGLAETLQLLIGCDHTDAASEKTLDKESIVVDMVKNLEEQENRKLTEDEVNQVREFVMSKQA